MRKITMAFILSILFMGGHAQSLTYRVVETKTLNYNSYSEEWVTEDSTYPSEMYAFFNDKKIKITDAANSSYFIYGNAEKKTMPTYVTSRWNAVDEKQRDCAIMLQIINPDDKEYRTTILYVIYNKLSFLYIIEPTE